MRRRAKTAAAPAPNSKTIDGSGTSTPELDPLLVLDDVLELLDELLLEELLEDEELPVELLDVLDVMLPEVVVVVMPELDDEELLLELLELLELDPELPDEPLEPELPDEPLEPELPLLLGPQ